MMTWSAWPDDQRAATEVPRNSGHPRHRSTTCDRSTGRPPRNRTHRYQRSLPAQSTRSAACKSSQAGPSVLLLTLLLLVITTLAALAATLLLVITALAATLLLAVAVLAGLAAAEAGLLLGVVLALLVTVEAGLLLGVQVLLVPAVLQLLRVHPDLVQQPGVLLRVNLIHPLQLLRSLLVVPAELTDQVQNLTGIKPHEHSFNSGPTQACASQDIGVPLPRRATPCAGR